MGNQRVLVISHNAFSTSNNMGKTLASLFHDFDKSEIAQLYFHSLKPDIDKSSSWFQITDFDVLKSIIARNKCGNITTFSQIESEEYEDKSKALVYRIGKDHSPAKLLLRDLVWKLGRWNTEKLYKWIESFNPTHIFFASGYSMFAYDVALSISKKYDIPLITYFCDDYYNENIKTLSPFHYIRRVLFTAKVEETVEQSNELVFISESMQKEYASIFKKDGKTIMTPYSKSLKAKNSIEDPIVLSYIGNISVGRWKVLIKVCEAVSRINLTDKKIIFEIYSGNAPESIINSFNILGTNYYKGKLSTTEVWNKMEDSDVLLHVESFEARYIAKTKHSLSTKIADSLASSRPILAIGPKEVNSINYLMRNNAAYIVDDENNIENKLRQFFLDNAIDNEILLNSRTLVDKNHNIDKNSKRLREIFCKFQVCKFQV